MKTKASRTKPKALDLSKLSREDKLKLLDLLEERSRRERLYKSPYKPHSGQKQVHVSDALERYLLAGNGWGKDAALSNEIHWAATGWNPIKKIHTPVPAKICLILDTAEKINDFLTEYRRWNDLPEEWCHKQGKPHVSYVTYDNGSTLTVITHEVSPMKLEGSQWTHVFANEPMPRFVFVAVARGGRIKGRPAQFLLCGTPIAQPWLRQEVYEPWIKGELPDVECFRGSTFDNEENLDEGYIERFSRKLTEQEKRTRLHGDFFDLEGLALAHLFKRDIHIIRDKDWYYDPEWPVVLAIDPHPRKKHVAILLGCDRDDNFYAIKELALKQTPRDFAHSLKEFMSGYRVIDIVVDSLGSQDMTGGEGFKSFIQILNEEGLRARATTYDEKQDEAFIARIQDVLRIPEETDNFGRRIPKLRIHESCRMLTSDIENVVWEFDKRNDVAKPKLAIGNKDALATLKYALATNLHFKKTKAKFYGLRSRSVYGFSPRRPSIKARTAKYAFGRGGQDD